jgi:hypothetical protein
LVTITAAFRKNRLAIGPRTSRSDSSRIARVPFDLDQGDEALRRRIARAISKRTGTWVALQMFRVSANPPLNYT